MGHYEWSAIHGVMLIVVGKGVVDNDIKGLHEGPRITINYDCFLDILGDLIQRSRSRSL